MTLPGNGTLKSIIASVVGGSLLFMAGATLSNSSRIAVAETKIQVLVDIQAANFRTMETNRTENRDEHRVITVKLEEIAKEIRK